MNGYVEKQNLVIDLRQALRPKQADLDVAKAKTGTGKKIAKSLVEWAVYIMIFLVIVWGTPKALTQALNTEYPIASITSSSMWPSLKQGDIVFIRGVSAKEELNLGEVVVYENEKGFTIHRVAKLNEDTLVTRGDANNKDDEPVSYDKVVGKAVEMGDKPLRIPWLGKLSMVFNTNGHE